VLLFDRLSRESLKRGGELEKIAALPVREKISRAKYIPEDKLEDFQSLEKELRGSYA